jgi:RNA-directed DNA polymerase
MVEDVEGREWAQGQPGEQPRVRTPRRSALQRALDRIRQAARRAQGQPATFDFLGFTPICRKTRHGKLTVRRNTIAQRRRQKRQAVKDPLRRRMHGPIPQQGAWLKSVRLGHYRSEAVPRKGTLLPVCRDTSLRDWWQTRRRRSPRHRMT